ncbi:MAG: hypothetical protein ACE5O2_06890, partial [Armatimonadota bacterium]
PGVDPHQFGDGADRQHRTVLVTLVALCHPYSPRVALPATSSTSLYARALRVKPVGSPGSM